MFARSFGRIVLGVWLVLWGLLPLLNVSFDGQATVLSVLAVIAGALLLLGK